MKRILSLSLAFVMIFACIFSLSSCFGPKPELDIGKAEDNLEDEDYTVNVVDDEDLLAPGQVERLSAYNGDDSIAIIEFENTKTAKLYYKQLKLERDQEIEEIKLEIKYMEHILDEYSKDLDSEDEDDYKDRLKDLRKELEEADEEVLFGRSGKIVWYGTKDAVEDSQG